MQIRSEVYIKGNLPTHLSDWAGQNAIILTQSKALDTYELYYDQQKLQLNWLGEEKFSPISVSMPNSRRLSSGSLLIKALGKKTKIVADLTAGLGVDAMTMAFFGRQVYCVERNPVLALLLFDGLYRCDDLISSRIKLFYSDSQQWLCLQESNLDAIYIDTMFIKKKQTAKSSKHMQILRRLVGKDQDSSTLIALALNQKVKRVVVKNSDDGIRLDHELLTQFQGKTIRFDVLKPRVHV